MDEKKKRLIFTLKDRLGCAFFGGGCGTEEDADIDSLFENGDIVEDDALSYEEIDDLEEEFEDELDED